MSIDDASPAEEHRFLAFLRKQRWWAGRIAVVPVHLSSWALIVFFLIRAIPGDPVITVTGGQITPEIYARVKRSLGLDGSIIHQLSTYYSSLLHFRLGNSMVSGTPVVSDLAVRLPATVELALQAMIAVVVVSLVGSYLVVMYPQNKVSRVVRGYACAAGAIPEVCVGIGLIAIFFTALRWAPAPLGRISPNLNQPSSITGMPLLDSVLHGNWSVTLSMMEHLVLPITVEIVAQSAVLIKLLTSGLEEAMEAAPTRFRIASGASRRVVVLSLYRRALPTAVAMLGMMFGYLLGGAVILETLFGFTGMGVYMIDAVNAKDLVVMQAFLLTMAAVSLTVFLIIDLVNMLLDPRRRPGVQVEGS